MSENGRTEAGRPGLWRDAIRASSELVGLRSRPDDDATMPGRDWVRRGAVVDIAVKLKERALASRKPKWRDGEPANMTAAALDALEWLEWMRRAGLLADRREDRKRLRRCVATLREYIGGAARTIEPEPERTP